MFTAWHNLLEIFRTLARLRLRRDATYPLAMVSGIIGNDPACPLHIMLSHFSDHLTHIAKHQSVARATPLVNTIIYILSDKFAAPLAEEGPIGDAPVLA